MHWCKIWIWNGEEINSIYPLIFRVKLRAPFQKLLAIKKGKTAIGGHCGLLYLYFSNQYYYEKQFCSRQYYCPGLKISSNFLEQPVCVKFHKRI